MTLLYSDPLFLEHQTGAHPERPLRLSTIHSHLQQTGLWDQCEIIPFAVQTTDGAKHFSPATREQVTRLHGGDYFDSLKQYAARGGGRLEADTVVSSRSFDAALAGAGAACDAVRRVLHGEDATALCLIRPPGHHALPNSAMGFCLFNNVALAAQAALHDESLDRVLIVDWDVHHGNGTQEMFWTSEQVGFFSSHRWPFYPGTGDAKETGAARGLGYTRNLPLEFGISRKEFITTFTRELEQFAGKVRPQLILLSAGFDAHREDPIGSLGLETEDFALLTRSVRRIAAGHCGGRVVSLLEGGYHPQRLAESVGLHLGELLSNIGGAPYAGSNNSPPQ